MSHYNHARLFGTFVLSLLWLLQQTSLLSNTSTIFVSAFQQPSQYRKNLASGSNTLLHRCSKIASLTPLYQSTTAASTTNTTETSSPPTSTQQNYDQKLPGTAQLDVPWEELGFQFRTTNSHVKLVYKESTGTWSEPELVTDPYLKLHIGATALHYGQSCLEGLKAFAHQDNKVYMFRPDESAKRMQASCRRVMMAELSTDLFVQAINLLVKDNLEYVPPFGSNGALYIRPILFGSGARIGLQPADEYTFLALATPVGDYYKGGLSAPVDCLIVTDYDRAAPQGVGGVKVAGNYAADLLPNTLTKKRGYPIALYLDAKTQTCIEEFSTSNFVGIDNKNKRFVTPKSPSVLPSITNKSLMQLAQDEGWKVETRDIKVEELETFDEVLAVGTAVVVTPVGSITIDKTDKKYTFGEPGEIGPTTKRLYQRVRDIQNGIVQDKYGWNILVQ